MSQYILSCHPRVLVFVAFLSPRILGHFGTYCDYLYVMLAFCTINLTGFVKMEVCKYESLFRGVRMVLEKDRGFRVRI